jgi:RHS repeat-associated protein
LHICQARNASGATTREYYTEGEFVPGSSAQPYYYGVDQIGTVRRAFASTSSAPAFGYDAYGNALQTTTPLTDFNYAGMFTNADSGLYLTQYRAYDSVSGRWLSRDPLGEARNIPANLYEYVGGNPVNDVDPLGLAETPYPPAGIPGGPYVPQPGQRPGGGTFMGPKQPKGPRPSCQYVPDTENGGPPGTPEPYWHYYPPGGGDQKYDQNGNPLPPGNEGHAQDDQAPAPPEPPAPAPEPEIPIPPEIPLEF